MHPSGWVGGAVICLEGGGACIRLEGGGACIRLERGDGDCIRMETRVSELASVWKVGRRGLHPSGKGVAEQASVWKGAALASVWTGARSLRPSALGGCGGACIRLEGLRMLHPSGNGFVACICLEEEGRSLHPSGQGRILYPSGTGGGACIRLE